MRTIWHGRRNRKLIQANNIPEIAEDIHVLPLTLMIAKPIGVMKMLDQDEADDKIIAVHSNDPEYSFYDSIDGLPPHRMIEIQSFFEDYKKL